MKTTPVNSLFVKNDIKIQNEQRYFKKSVIPDFI